MKLNDKNKKDEHINNKQNENDIEIVMGDDSNLNISTVGDCVNNLRPKDSDKKQRNIVIPKSKGGK